MVLSPTISQFSTPFDHFAEQRRSFNAVGMPKTKNHKHVYSSNYTGSMRITISSARGIVSVICSAHMLCLVVQLRQCHLELNRRHILLSIILLVDITLSSEGNSGSGAFAKWRPNIRLPYLLCMLIVLRPLLSRYPLSSRCPLIHSLRSSMSAGTLSVRGRMSEIAARLQRSEVACHSPESH